MEWSPEQERAIGSVQDWMGDRSSQVFRLFGGAGTGKTTIAKAIAEGIEGQVLFGAYTGKAAHVLQTKGCHGAKTIHSMIYHSRDQSAARLKNLEQQLMELMNELRSELHDEDKHMANDDPRVLQIKAEIDQERQNVSRPMFQLNYDSEVKHARLVIIDECSMVDGSMADDLLFFGTKILVLGDPGQLPPVMGEGFFTKDEPDFLLQEIHRQAKDNPIIAMAAKVRAGEALDLGTWGESRVIPLSEVNPQLVLDAGQLLVGRNATRRDYNRRMRQLLHPEHQSWIPLGGDKLVCLRNNHEIGLLNGAQWETMGVLSANEDRVIMKVRSLDNDALLDVEAHSHHLLGRTDALPWWSRKEAEEFDYGYAMTVHKSQGSQWDDVVVFDESYCFRDDRHKWLYTAITRAAKQITVVKT